MDFDNPFGLEVVQTLSKPEWFREVMLQLEKDLGLFGEDIHIDLDLQNGYKANKQRVEEVIAKWLRSDRNSLFAFLYRVDVPEQRLHRAMAMFPEQSTEALITQLILGRELQKVWFRHHFKK
ncbi:MAG: hypothetical protein H6585_13120 [Flavobacteriales bacterium]|nr:hypothetical protein [Flavobacteriales bacterium]MCB9449274.1 hypothetical protein [Flavobacteriales bacterium]